MKFDRATMTLEQADDVFCGKRLEGICVAGTREDAEGQQQFDGMEGEHAPHVSGVFDSKRFAATPKAFSAGLTFALETIEVGDLAELAKRKGTLKVTVLGVLDEGSDGHDDDAQEGDDGEEVPEE